MVKNNILLAVLLAAFSAHTTMFSLPGLPQSSEEALKTAGAFALLEAGSAYLFPKFVPPAVTVTSGDTLPVKSCSDVVTLHVNGKAVNFSGGISVALIPAALKWIAASYIVGFFNNVKRANGTDK